MRADGDGSIEEDVERLKDFAREAPVIRLVARLIAQAVERRASDIHIEPREDRVRVRLRIDGVLIAWDDLPKNIQPGVISRIKIMARLNNAEGRLPQDGRIKVPGAGMRWTAGFDGADALWRERGARILDRQDVKLDFASLGFDAQAIQLLRR